MLHNAVSEGCGQFAIRRRLGASPAERADCSAMTGCPDVFELSNGDFAVIGLDVSETLPLPSDAGKADAERIVVVPRAVLLAAITHLASEIS